MYIYIYIDTHNYYSCPTGGRIGAQEHPTYIWRGVPHGPPKRQTLRALLRRVRLAKHCRNSILWNLEFDETEPLCFHALTNKRRQVIVLFEPKQLDEVSNRIPPTSHRGTSVFHWRWDRCSNPTPSYLILYIYIYM